MSDHSSLAGARVDQLLPNLSPGDAASDTCLAFQRILAAAGADSLLWSVEIHPARRDAAQRFDERALRKRSPDLVLLHHTTGSSVPARLRATGVPYGVYFQNVTPPRYFLGANDLLAGIAWRGLAELPAIVAGARLLACPSRFNAELLRAAGAAAVDLVPIPFDPAAHDVPPDEATLARFDDGARNVLFVGRVAPNKRQDELLEMFRYYSRDVRDGTKGRLLLVGSSEAAPLFRDWLARAIDAWGLRDVHLLGHVSDAVRAACYRVARVFVSLSEHEGFGVPLIEAMHHGVPVIARDAGAVAETLGGAGLLVRGQDPRRLAELVRLVAEPGEPRELMVEAGRRRAAELRPDAVAPLLVGAIARELRRSTPVCP